MGSERKPWRSAVAATGAWAERAGGGVCGRFVKPDHAVRMVAAVVAKLDLRRFAEAIEAREGVAGRDATDPELLVALW